MNMYSVYDRVAEEFSPPNTVKNNGVAYRQFRELLAKLPEYAKNDYCLYKIAEYDETSGKIIPLDHIESVEDGNDE